MTTHDVSHEFFGLIHTDEIEKFVLNEAELLPSNLGELQSDLLLGFFKKSMHGDASLTHVNGLPETGALLLSQHDTATSDVYSVRYRINPLGHAAVSIVVPHNLDLPRLAEVHSYSFAGNHLNEEAPQPLSDKQYRILHHIGHAANLTQALRIAS